MSEERTYSHKRSAITIAVLFIIATVVFSLAELIYAPILNAPDYLETIYPNRIQVMVGLLIQVGSLVAVPLIAVVFYPILRRQSEILALAYVVMRSFEALLLIGVGEINKLSLIGLSKEYIAGGGAERQVIEHIGASIQSVNYWGAEAGPVFLLFFVIGAIILNILLFQSRLVPRWISLAGTVSAVLLLSGSLFYTFELISPTLATGLMVPIAVQEMVFALWLIFKGFDERALKDLGYLKTA